MRSHMKSRWLGIGAYLLGGVLVGWIVTGCASIMHGTHQDISVGSAPTGATVTVDKLPSGTTPVVAKLSRKDSHTVRIEMQGYQPYETVLTRQVSGWVWGNLAFGGLIGLAVDAISGGLYKLTPIQIQSELKKEGMGVRIEKDMILIAVTLEPDPQWQKIGELDKLERP